MRTKKLIVALLSSGILTTVAWGQDPSFSQYFSSPLNINPALTANIDGNWRFIANLRNQWVGPSSPYATGTVSFDTRVFQNKLPEGSTFGIGAMMMYDKAMQGALKSSYVSLNTSYNITLAEEDATQRLGIGIGGIFGNKQVDFSKLTFGEQFTGYGFDTNLPTGESALSNMKPYLSASLGILYSITTDNTNIDLGVSAYHLNKPKQTVLENPNQYLKIRYVGHANFDTYLTEQLLLNANGVYQRQGTTGYVSIGGGLGYFLTDDPENVELNIGLWYWLNNAVIPYIGVMYQNIQLGLSYDISVSKLSLAAEKPKSFELSLIIRAKKSKGYIQSPWK